jgi:hypothetical protein
MTNETTSWTLDVKEDPETGDKIIEFPPDLLQSAAWKEGDALMWTDNKDGSWTLSKVEENDGLTSTIDSV